MSTGLAAYLIVGAIFAIWGISAIVNHNRFDDITGVLIVATVHITLWPFCLVGWLLGGSISRSGYAEQWRGLGTSDRA